MGRSHRPEVTRRHFYATQTANFRPYNNKTAAHSFTADILIIFFQIATLSNLDSLPTRRGSSNSSCKVNLERGHFFPREEKHPQKVRHGGWMKKAASLPSFLPSYVLVLMVPLLFFVFLLF